jgi:deoxyadenosine/deoxycytidine kinase
MDRGYIGELNEAYNHFFFHFTEAPPLVVNTNAIDFVSNAEDFEDLRKRIVTHRQGTTYYAPIERESTT